MTHSMALASDKNYKFSVPPFPPFSHFDGLSHCKGVGVIAMELITININGAFSAYYFPYARMLNSLKTGELDVALLFKNNTVTEEVEYIGPLSMSKILVISQPESIIKEYKDLYLLDSIGVIRNAQFNKKFDQDKQLNKVNVSSYNQAIRLLKLKRIHAVIGSKIGLEYAIYQENMDKKLIANAFNFGEKESGLHLSKKSPLMKILPLIKASVKEVYKENLLEQLYKQQISRCTAL